MALEVILFERSAMKLSYLHFEVVGSVVFRANTSIKRRTISLHPPLEGQQIRILVRFFVVADVDAVSMAFDGDD